jgi:hypothetical protein
MRLINCRKKMINVSSSNAETLKNKLGYTIGDKDSQLGYESSEIFALV